jgi:hypothetical protein
MIQPETVADKKKPVDLLKSTGYKGFKGVSMLLETT